MVRLISAWWVLWCCVAAGSVPRHTALPLGGATPAPARSVIVNGVAAQTNADFTFARSGVGLVNGQNIFTNVAENLAAVRVTYTRGADLSGTMQGAGGIGGLPARTDASGSAFYHADGAGNITGLMDRNGDLAARYLYGPFGRLVGKWGPMADANAMQFSSMPRHANSGLSLYPFRNYDANLQRWLTRDPIGEAGGINLYGFVGNNPINWIDPLGLTIFPVGSIGPIQPGDGYQLTADITSMMQPDGSLRLQEPGITDLSGDFYDFFNLARSIPRSLGDLAQPAVCWAKQKAKDKLLRDFPTRNTKNWSANFGSEAEARALARTKLGSNPVEVSPGKWRSADGKWQYRANPGDLTDRHIHIEELNPKTGEVIQNLHLRWPENTGR